MDFLTDESHVILDGGLATELVRDGHEIDTSVPLFMKYFECSKIEAEKYISWTVILARDAREEFWQKYQNDRSSNEAIYKTGGRRYPLIAGSIGPYGACQHDASEYTGAYVDGMSEEELIEWHRPRLKLLLESGVDIVAVETIPALKEAVAVAKLLKEFPRARAWITFSCKDGLHLCHGERFADAFSSLTTHDQVFGIGINCTHPSHVESLLKSLKDQSVASNKIKVVYPNSGERWEAGKWIECKDQKMLSDYASSWMDAGATWIGGCCRITAVDIKKLRQKLD